MCRHNPTGTFPLTYSKYFFKLGRFLVHSLKNNGFQNSHMQTTPTAYSTYECSNLSCFYMLFKLQFEKIINFYQFGIKAVHLNADFGKLIHHVIWQFPHPDITSASYRFSQHLHIGQMPPYLIAFIPNWRSGSIRCVVVADSNQFATPACDLFPLRQCSECLCRKEFLCPQEKVCILPAVGRLRASHCALSTRRVWHRRTILPLFYSHSDHNRQRDACGKSEHIISLPTPIFQVCQMLWRTTLWHLPEEVLHANG